MLERLETIRNEALAALESAREKGKEAIEELRVKVTGRKGELTEILKSIGSLPPEERPKAGQLANKYKKEIEAAIKKALKAAEQSGEAACISGLDPTLPGRRLPSGRLHPVTKVMDEVCAIFNRMGFSVAQGPEV